MCVNGEVVGTYRKRLLPNYAVFDEARTFTPGADDEPLALYVIAGAKVGISVCEDILWSPFGPLATQAAGGAELSINVNGSPYHWEKDAGRERMVATRAQGRTHRDRLRESGRRPGRARVRRRLVRGRRRGSAARPHPAVRRGPDDRRRLSPAIYRHRLLDPRGKRAPTPNCRMSTSVTAAGDRTARWRRRRSPIRWHPTTSCTKRSCWGRATTAARTASPTSSSGCRAASTRASSR